VRLLDDAALVESVLADVESCRLDEHHKALFRFLDKMNRESATLTDRDLDVVRAAGWTDGALYFAITVCAFFNFHNRWIDATGVHAFSDEAHRQGGRRSAQSRYVRN
jgi:alkylhydroperoxidase family enzyme